MAIRLAVQHVHAANDLHNGSALHGVCAMGLWPFTSSKRAERRLTVELSRAAALALHMRDNPKRRRVERIVRAQRRLSGAAALKGLGVPGRAETLACQSEEWDEQSAMQAPLALGNPASRVSVRPAPLNLPGEIDGQV